MFGVGKGGFRGFWKAFLPCLPSLSPWLFSTSPLWRPLCRRSRGFGPVAKAEGSSKGVSLTISCALVLWTSQAAANLLVFMWLVTF